MRKKVNSCRECGLVQIHFDEFFCSIDFIKTSILTTYRALSWLVTSNLKCLFPTLQKKNNYAGISSMLCEDKSIISNRGEDYTTAFPHDKEFCAEISQVIQKPIVF